MFHFIYSHFCINQRCPRYTCMMNSSSYTFHHVVNLSTSVPSYPVLESSIQFYHQRSCFARKEFYPSTIKSRIQKRIALFYLFKICQILASMYSLRKFTFNIFTLYVRIQYHFFESIYFDAIIIITYQVNFNSLRTSYHTCWNTSGDKQLLWSRHLFSLLANCLKI